MVNVFQKKVLMLALYAGEIMMRNGAEIYRVEDTITRICRSCNIDNVEVFATPTGIFLSLDKGGEDDDTQTYVKRIKGVSTNLKKISLVNQFSRKFTANSISVDSGMNVLKRIDRSRTYPMPVRVLGAVMVSSAFCMIFGGSLIDCPLSVIAGAVAYVFSVLLSMLDVNSFVSVFCSCAVATILTMIASTAIPGTSHDSIIVGWIMLFVPGVALTNSIRDFLSGDMLAGLARLMETVLTAVSLAAGVGVVLKLWEVIGGILS